MAVVSDISGLFLHDIHLDTAESGNEESPTFTQTFNNVTYEDLQTAYPHLSSRFSDDTSDPTMSHDGSEASSEGVTMGEECSPVLIPGTDSCLKYDDIPSSSSALDYDPYFDRPHTQWRYDAPIHDVGSSDAPSTLTTGPEVHENISSGGAPAAQGSELGSPETGSVSGIINHGPHVMPRTIRRVRFRLPILSVRASAERLKSQAIDDAAPVLNSLKRSATSCCTWLIKKTKETMSKSKKKQEEYRGYRDTEREGGGVDGDGGGRGGRGNNMDTFIISKMKRLKKAFKRLA